MEEVFKVGKKFFGVSGKEYSKKQVQDYGAGGIWHCHGIGAPVVEVDEVEDYTEYDKDEE
jgi:hypothetical protein